MRDQEGGMRERGGGSERPRGRYEGERGVRNQEGGMRERGGGE